MTSATHEIILNKLCFVTQSDGRVTTAQVRVDIPSPCRQPNGPGKLKSFNSLESFRTEARSIGSAIREALKNGAK